MHTIIIQLKPIKHLSWSPTDHILLICTENSKLYSFTLAQIYVFEIEIDLNINLAFNKISWSENGKYFILQDKNNFILGNPLISSQNKINTEEEQEPDQETEKDHEQDQDQDSRYNPNTGNINESHSNNYDTEEPNHYMDGENENNYQAHDDDNNYDPDDDHGNYRNPRNYGNVGHNNDNNNNDDEDYQHNDGNY